MPVKRRLAKGRSHRITPEAIAAYEAGDYMALHAALGLRPWEASPLPIEMTPLGCRQGPPPDYMRNSPPAVEDWEQAQELQRLLQEAARQ